MGSNAPQWQNPRGKERKKFGPNGNGKTPHTYAGISGLPKVLKRWRETKKLKIAAAAAEIGVSPAAWGHWETGARFPGGADLLKLSSHTGIPVHRLICPHIEGCIEAVRQSV
jgi:hypothetical protein